MGGSLWRQAIGSDEAVELTHPRAAYDYQPDVAPDGSSVLFARYDGNAIALWRRDFASGREQQLTSGNAVNVEPRLSPDGKRIAWVSTQGTGHFNLFIADIGPRGLGNAHPLLGERQSKISRYYYSPFDHALNPSWTPDGKRILYVTNHEVAWGTGDIWSVAVDDPQDRREVLSEETSWSARPETSPDGKSVLFASYHGRQWRQLWVTTPDGAAPLPLTLRRVRSLECALVARRDARRPDQQCARQYRPHPARRGRRRRNAGGGDQPALSRRTRHADICDIGRPARVAIIGSDGRAAAPNDGWMHADDGFDRAHQSSETHYFHCKVRCTIDLPAGDTSIWVQRGFRYLPWKQTVTLAPGSSPNVNITLQPNDLPASFGTWQSADLHVHMNYGGHYRATPETLDLQARAEDLDAVYNLLVNKEERVPDISYPVGRDPVSGHGVTILHSQEYHTSYWGHLGLLELNDHYLAPGFSAYQNSPLASPYPDNGAIADLAHAQGALVGYVHPFDTVPDPAKDKTLTNELPADVAHGKVDYIEIVGFSDHKATAAVWYKLLNLGYRLPAGAGTDAMTNYASLRGPVGMNRVFLDTGGDTRPGAHQGRAQGRPDLRQQRPAARPRDRRQAPGRHDLARRAGQAPLPGRVALLRRRRSSRAGPQWHGGEGVRTDRRPPDLRRRGRARCGARRLGAAACVERPRRPARARHLSLRDDQPGLSRPAGRPSRPTRPTPHTSPRGSIG